MEQLPHKKRLKATGTVQFGKAMTKKGVVGSTNPIVSTDRQRGSLQFISKQLEHPPIQLPVMEAGTHMCKQYRKQGLL